MANVKIPSERSAPSQPWDHEAQADRYANSRPHYAGQVDAYAPRPKLGAGGPHNRPAKGHE